MVYFTGFWTKSEYRRLLALTPDNVRCDGSYVYQEAEDYYGQYRRYVVTSAIAHFPLPQSNIDFYYTSE
jgi:hypothetical protein